MKLKGRIHLPQNLIKKLSWGIAGCGKFTETTFLPELLKIRKNKVNSVYSGNLDRAKFRDRRSEYTRYNGTKHDGNRRLFGTPNIITYFHISSFEDLDLGNKL